MITRIAPAVVAALFASSSVIQAEVKPHTLFSENAVLQQKVKVPVWGTAKDGEKVTVEFQKQRVSTIATNGSWKVTLKPLVAGGPFTLKIVAENTIILTNILVGEVWVASGQSNMGMAVGDCIGGKEAIASSTDSMLRLLSVPFKRSEAVERDVEVSWKESNPYYAGMFSGVAYFFGRDLRKQLNVPVGLMHCSWGGSIAEAWTPRSYLEADPFFKVIFDRYPAMLKRYEQDLAQYRQNEPELKKKHHEAVAKAKAEGAKEPPAPKPPANPAENGKVQRDRPYGIYNAMLAPLQPYAIRGALWYQGESSAGRSFEYYRILPTMIRAWRETWGQGDFPFLIVQLPPYTKPDAEPTDSSWAEIREAQQITAKTVKNSAVAVTGDCGGDGDLHPNIKEPIGVRLALAARRLAYGENVEYSGPLFDSIKIKDGRATISFTHAKGGLVSKEGELKGFAVAGEDRKFVNAKAEIKGDKVVVWSPQVTKPVAVRYGWANYPVINLYNKQGLPASPFRTDGFPVSTQPPK